jgi:CARDB
MTRAKIHRAVVIRVAVLAAVAAGLVPAAAAGAAGPVATGRATATHGPAGGQPRTDPPYTARLASCRRSPLVANRVAVVSATMRTSAGATHLQLKIDLYQRPLAGGRWTLRSDVPGLGTWSSPNDPTIGSRPGDVFKYRQAVARLVVPFAYRFKVAFRWLDSGGNVVREASASTRVCREPDLRPDVTIVRVRARRTGKPGIVHYSVLVGDIGRSGVRSVTIAATLPGDAAPTTHTRTIARLVPGLPQTVTFTGPGCAAGAPGPSFSADPSNAIEESNEADNVLTLTCPVP